MTQAPLQPKTLERFVLWFFIFALAMGLRSFDWHWVWRLDHLFYDYAVQALARDAPEDIIIVAIDEQSLREIGDWPWQRQVHAQLIDILHQAGASVIGLDLILSEPTTQDTQADQQLAQAIARHGRTVLPILIEEIRLGGQFLETLPTQALSDVAQLGHVHVDLDPDGIVRRVFLKEGLREAYWPHFALTLLQLAGHDIDRYLIGRRAPATSTGSLMQWRRDFEMFIPYAGPPNHFKRISYQQVLQGAFAADSFKDKWVLIGATASGMGDVLPTPTSGDHEPMPGVEVHANIIDALRLGMNIRQTGDILTLLITAILVLLPAFAFTHFTPRWNLIVTLALIGVTIGFDVLLLSTYYYWFPPSAAIICLVLCYPLWSWRRLEQALRYLNLELNTLHEEQAKLPVTRTPNIAQGLIFLQELLPIQGWVLYNNNGTIVSQQGQAPHPVPHHICAQHWIRAQHQIWIDINTTELGALGVSWQEDTTPHSSQQAVLDNLVQRYRAEVGHTRKDADLIYSRIQQVQTATDRMRALNRFVSDTVSQMADGTLVVDASGSVVLINQRAEYYLNITVDLSEGPQWLPNYLAALEISHHLSWAELLRTTLLDQHSVQIEARSNRGIDLLVQIAPLSTETGLLGGFIVNLSDISLLKDSERKRNELLSFLSHDLRSPLVSLLALLEVGKAKNRDPELNKLLARMENYTQRTLSLADQFLQLAQAESGEEITFAPVNIANLIDAAVESLYSLALQKNIRIRTQLPASDNWVDGDGNLLERALINVIGNAIKYSPEQSTVLVSVDVQADRLRCTVADQGIGIEASEIATLFDRFRRAENAKISTTGGVGLGLALVKAVIDRHQGSIAVTSTLGTGSQFIITLPKLAPTG